MVQKSFHHNTESEIDNEVSFGANILCHTFLLSMLCAQKQVKLGKNYFMNYSNILTSRGWCL